jgi:glycylpeptide N-tetradecanoyltransferase
MSEPSKEAADAERGDVVEEATTHIGEPRDGDGSAEEEDEPLDAAAEGPAATSSKGKKKKKKSKRTKIKSAIGLGHQARDVDAPPGSSSPASKLTPEMVDQLLEMNPSLKGEVAGMDKPGAVEAPKKLDIADLLTGMVRGGDRTVRHMANKISVREWQKPERHGILQVLADPARPAI